MYINLPPLEDEKYKYDLTILFYDTLCTQLHWWLAEYTVSWHIIIIPLQMDGAVYRVNDFCLWGLHGSKSNRMQCWGSVTFWYGSGSADPYHWLKDPNSDPDPDPTPDTAQDSAIFVSNLQGWQLKLFKATLTSFFKDKKSQNSRSRGFSYYFCLMIEGSGSATLAGCYRKWSLSTDFRCWRHAHSRKFLIKYIIKND